MPGTTTNHSALYKIVFAKGIERLFNEDVEFRKVLKLGTEHWSGRSLILKTDYRRAAVGGVIGESAAERSAGAKAYLELTVPEATIYAKHGVTLQAIYASKGDDAAAAASLAEEIKGSRNDLALFTNLMFYGDGTGNLARVNGDPGVDSAPTVTVDPYSATLGKFGTKHLRPGMAVDFWDDNSANDEDYTVKNVAAAVIDAVFSATTFRLATGTYAGITDNDFICNANERGADGAGTYVGCGGLVNLIGDNSVDDTFEGITRSDYGPIMYSLVYPLSAALTETGMDNFLTRLRVNAQGAGQRADLPDVMFTEPATANTLRAIHAAARQFQDTSGDLGMKGELRFHHGSWSPRLVESVYVNPGNMYAINSSDLKVYEKRKAGLVDEDGLQLRKVPDYLEFGGELAWIGALGMKHPTLHGVMTNITVTDMGVVVN